MEYLREAVVLTAPDESYLRERTTQSRASERVRYHDFSENSGEAERGTRYNAGRRRTGLRLTFSRGMPQSSWGRVAAGSAILAILGVGWAAAGIARRTVLHDERFVLASGSAILTEGNHHLSRAQLVEVFGGDIERNILRVSLDDRKAELEQIPWVKHATVMRLLPDHISVIVEERKPTAFARQAGHVGLVDAAGVLLDMEGYDAEQPGYSFPVVTGISQGDPPSVRAARMKLFRDFTKDLDASGEKISAKLSEIDLSNPEDVKALIPDRGADVLVHFGDSDFLDRYKRYEAHLEEWRTQYPKLSAVDMRYERQVVLEMQPGTGVPGAGGTHEIGEQASLPGTKAAAGRAVLPNRAHLVAKGLVPSRVSGGPVRAKLPAKALPHSARKADQP